MQIDKAFHIQQMSFVSREVETGVTSHHDVCDVSSKMPDFLRFHKSVIDQITSKQTKRGHAGSHDHD